MNLTDCEDIVTNFQVVVRMRPPHEDRDEGDVIVQKTSSDSISFNGQTFTFDSVADIEATQAC